MTNKKPASENTKGRELQGEGNYDASRKYDEGLQRYVREGNSDEAADRARKALEGPEGPALRLAEDAAKRGPNVAAPKPSKAEREPKERKEQKTPKEPAKKATKPPAS